MQGVVSWEGVHFPRGQMAHIQVSSSYGVPAWYSAWRVARGLWCVERCVWRVVCGVWRAVRGVALCGEGLVWCVV